ncbi:hypothetical protein U1Q18_007696, partial [Sarracenia purpurea var. burkii]
AACLCFWGSVVCWGPLFGAYGACVLALGGCLVPCFLLLLSRGWFCWGWVLVALLMGAGGLLGGGGLVTPLGGCGLGGVFRVGLVVAVCFCVMVSPSGGGLFILLQIWVFCLLFSGGIFGASSCSARFL